MTADSENPSGAESQESAAPKSLKEREALVRQRLDRLMERVKLAHADTIALQAPLKRLLEVRATLAKAIDGSHPQIVALMNAYRARVDMALGTLGERARAADGAFELRRCLGDSLRGEWIRCRSLHALQASVWRQEIDSQSSNLAEELRPVTTWLTAGKNRWLTDVEQPEPPTDSATEDSAP